MPRRVASFEILGEAGQGGMGVVYRARDLKLDRQVALKRPRPELFDSPGFLERFMDEARTASSLMHPNITTVFEVLEEDGVPWLVMELIDGASLRSLLSSGQPLSCGDVLRHAEGLTDALRVAHLNGVLHRDINPNNVLVGKDGRARLSDFGLARAWQQPAGGHDASKLTTAPDTTSGIAGTRGYMSPEQALGKPVDPRSDLFSLGVVLYEMCTGRPAFLHRDTGEWLDALLHREPEPISRVNREVPVEFEEVVRRALAKRPFQRYQSANEMLLDLRAVRRKLASESGYSQPSFDRVRRRRAGWIGAAVAAVVLVIGAAVLPPLLAPAPRAPRLEANHRRVTTGAGWEGQPAISPDGTMIAYTSDEAGSRDLWLVRPDGGEPLALTDDAASETDPAWFPDGSAIAYVSDRDGTPAIWRISTLGGSSVKLVSDAADPAISPDGTRIAFSRAGPDGLPRIVVAPLGDPGDARVLTGDDDGFWGHYAPAWSPDGRTLCYTDFKHLWLVPADGGRARRLTSGDSTDTSPVWSPDGTLIFFSSFSVSELTYALWCVSVADDALLRLTSGTSDEAHPSLSADGTRLAYATLSARSDIALLDRATGRRSEIAGVGEETNPVVAPDGSSVAFVSDRRGGFDVWLQPLRQGLPDGPPHQLTDHDGTVAVPAFSPDGRWLAYHRVVDGQRDVWIVPAAGGVSQRFTDHAAREIHPSFSPDGATLAFVSDRDGVEQIWLAPVTDGRRTGEPRRLTADEAVHWVPSWSPDGGRIACVVQGGYYSEVWLFGVDDDAPPVQVTRGADARCVQWAPAGDELLVSGTWGTDRISLRVVSLRDGSTRPLEPVVELGSDDPGSGLFGVDATGRIVAYEVIERRGDVWLAGVDLDRRHAGSWR